MPGCWDDILVLWNVSDDFVWWPAQVLFTKRVQLGIIRDFDVIGHGTLRYASRVDYEESDSEVEFLLSGDGECFIRERGGGVEQGNSKPCLWRFKNGENVSDESDQNWNQTNADTGPSSAGKRPKVSSSPMPHIRKISVANELRHKEILRAYQNLSDRVSTLENYISEKSALPNLSIPNLLHLKVILRSKLFRRCQASFKPKKALTSGKEGLLCDYVRVSTDCMLSSFTSVIRDIQQMASSREMRDVHFKPSTMSISSPSRASKIVEVRLGSFLALCQWLDIRDESDMKYLLCRRGEEKDKRYVRILGCLSKSQPSGRDREDCEIQRISVGHCHGIRFRPRGTDNISTLERTSHEVVPPSCGFAYFERDCRNWDASLGRYLTSWKKRMVSTDSNSAHLSECWNGENDSETPAFSIMWRRSSCPSGRTWSADAVHTSGEIPGKIEISMPSIVCHGNSTATQIFQLFESLT